VGSENNTKIMTKRIPKSVIYVIVLIAVLIIGILIGKSGTNNTSIAGKTQQVANLGGSVKDSSESSSINANRSVKVTRVLDGDTIEIESGERVKYLGINAPESGQPFFTEATRENERLVAGRTVALEFDVQTQDRYKRLLAYVWVGDVLVNEEIVKNGYAVIETI